VFDLLGRIDAAIDGVRFSVALAAISDFSRSSLIKKNMAKLNKVGEFRPPCRRPYWDEDSLSSRYIL